jgi:hypothetical protein
MPGILAIHHDGILLLLPYELPVVGFTPSAGEMSTRSFMTGKMPGVYDLHSICIVCHNRVVAWSVEIGDEFEPEFTELPEDVRTEILAHARLLQQFGPQLGRPRVDTLNNSRHANMKELRFSAADGEWRVAFAFDTKRKAILLVAGDKSGGSEKRFYKQLIAKADDRFDAHLVRLKKKKRK